MKAVKAKCPHCGPMYAYAETTPDNTLEFMTEDEWLKWVKLDDIIDDGLGLEPCEHSGSLPFYAVNAARCSAMAGAATNPWDDIVEHAWACGMWTEKVLVVDWFADKDGIYQVWYFECEDGHETEIIREGNEIAVEAQA